MTEQLPDISEEVRSLILAVESCLSTLATIQPRTKSEAELRRRLRDYLETAEGSLIDAHSFLLDAASFDAESLPLFLSEYTEVLP